MDERIKFLQIRITRNSYEKFKNKCQFYDITEGEIFAFFVEKFLDGSFDRELKLPID